MNITDLNDNLDIIVDYLSIKDILHLTQTSNYFNKYIRIIKIKKRITKCNYYKLKKVVDFWRNYHMRLFHRRINVISWRKKDRDPEAEILLF